MRKIIHIDMDCFFAAVEVKHNSDLLKKPIAVGGRAEKRGVIATASYEARRYGVRSAMATATALRLCPDLILIHPKFSLYKQESLEIKKIFQRFSKKIEPLSLDEAFLDVTDSDLPRGSATLLAKRIRQTILMERGLTASAGVASNKFLAKVASDINKPNGQFTINPKDNFRFTSQLPVEKIFGVGRKTKERMNNRGLHLCSDLQKLSLLELQMHFGSFGTKLHSLCRGLDERPVQGSSVRKSFSVEKTFSQDIKTRTDASSAFEKIFNEFENRFLNSQHKESEIKGFSFKIKSYDFILKTKDHTLEKESLPPFENLRESFLNFWDELQSPARLIGFGVRFKNLENASQLEFDIGSP